MDFAPARQWMFLLAGSGQTEVLRAGDAILVEDTTGPGHATEVFEDALIATVQI
ncbi:hypothetical protein [Nocardioides jiangxiensis]|uniref:Quercetin 2,3-dioxygenase C-terminal cupin domain-containing protein n=1 Tax=Nocardioides jiangxiensis TaxID=3064524 RepID=A0ABT9B8F8_9ACTN|nr:hypothetical protein [Nocardioides sp. WY-20]MDO7869566.1 hypothetical protein [Nocardioides sp. WY-20]